MTYEEWISERTTGNMRVRPTMRAERLSNGYVRVDLRGSGLMHLWERVGDDVRLLHGNGFTTREERELVRGLI